ncbi:MAG: prephenate dehydrogenase/arogenate dehydrogenase family protein [Acidimicrobiales bacterium]|nr:prephenate dehydrogenase/arogenate dehydrogenase family protein [Acidimicrobiales bacterium]
MVDKFVHSDLRATVVGLGLIGGSIAWALKEAGAFVSGRDIEFSVENEALSRKLIDQVGSDEKADIVFICTPLEATVKEIEKELLIIGTKCVVSDVSGVKQSIVEAISDPRFIGGHPMAGSEQNTLMGASPQLFNAATWVLTPTDKTDPQSYSFLQGIVSNVFQAVAVALPSKDHDEFVAVVSHVPHLTAATLMTLASKASDDHDWLFKLAAGGFRDMTRVAAGSPYIWPDVCIDNKEAISKVINQLVIELQELSSLIDSGDKELILAKLQKAQFARQALPIRATRPEELCEIRIRISDAPGELVKVLDVARVRGINIFDVEIAHSVDGSQGILVLIVANIDRELLCSGFLEAGYGVSAHKLG